MSAEVCWRMGCSQNDNCSSNSFLLLDLMFIRYKGQVDTQISQFKWDIGSYQPKFYFSYLPIYWLDIGACVCVCVLCVCCVCVCVCVCVCLWCVCVRARARIDTAKWHDCILSVLGLEAQISLEVGTKREFYFSLFLSHRIHARRALPVGFRLRWYIWFTFRFTVTVSNISLKTWMMGRNLFESRLTICLFNK